MEKLAARPVAAPAATAPQVGVPAELTGARTPSCRPELGVALARALATVLMVCALTLSGASTGGAQEDEPTATPTPMDGMSGFGLPPTVLLYVAPTYGVAPLTVGGLADVLDPEGAEVVEYEWNFGDGHVSVLPPPNIVTNTYVTPGSYIVRLRVSTADGRSASALVGVLVEPPAGK